MTSPSKPPSRPSSLPRQIMPKQPPEDRIANWIEVSLGFSEEQALREASRCLNCLKPKCVQGCPVNIEIPRFIQLLKNKNFEGAYHAIKEKNCLPAICGRVCPQETQCEAQCILGKKGEPVAIGALERFVADYAIEKKVLDEPVAVPKAFKVAIVGSGPAGLTAAGELARKGYRVTLFEALHEAGGVLRYGIPEFRLPKWIVSEEVKRLETIGVHIDLNHVIGKILTIDELVQMGYRAVFIGTGAGLPKLMDIPGMNLVGVYSANEFLTRVNLMMSYRFPENDTPILTGETAVVIGGGNVALDAARVAVRLGARSVTILYRRQKEEMPARDDEIQNALEEGITFHCLAIPVVAIGDSNGILKAVEYVDCTVGPPDETGRSTPIPNLESKHKLDTNILICATGQNPNPLIPSTHPYLELNNRGGIAVDSTTLMSNRDGVFAGGDIVSGAATVILGMAAGKKAAAAIDTYIQQKYNQTSDK